MSITDKTLHSHIKQAKKNVSQKYTAYSIGNNLWFRVNVNNGNASWLYRVALPNPTKKSRYNFSYYTIGKYPTISLLSAKIEATKLKEQIKSGINPNDNKNNPSPQIITFKFIWDKWLAVSTCKPRTLYDLNSIFNQYFKSISEVNIYSLSDRFVWDTIIQPILDKGYIPRAKCVLSNLKLVMKFAHHSYIINELKFERLFIDQAYKVNSVRERVLSDTELKRFLLSMKHLYVNKDIDMVSHHCLLLILILGTRKTELAHARWEQYNIKDKTLLLTNTKNNDDLLIKLPRQALKLLDELNAIKINVYIFYGINVARLNTRRLGYVLNDIISHAKIEDLTIHDLRRTFSSKLSGLGFRYELIDKATNHRIQGTRKHYQHDDMLEERYNMLQHWADYLDGVIK